MARLKGYTVLRYPRERLEEADDYLKIDVVNYKPPGFGARGSEQFRLKSSDDPNSDLTESIKTPVASVYLPIPRQI